jgi:hypothetical protein
MADPKVLAVARGTLDEDVTATTPRGTSDVRVVVLPAVRVVAIRAVRTFLQAWLGFLGASVVGVIPTDPLAPPEAWQRIAIAAGLALWPAAISGIQNTLEIVSRLDVTQPELRG